MKNVFKKSIGVMLAAIVAMQGMTAFAATKTYKDGDIEFCQPSEIYVNETFEDKTVANGDTELANAKWKIRNSELDNGALYIPASGDVKSYAELSLTTPLNGVGKKYVVSYDVTRLEPVGGNYVNINGKKTIASFVADGTWDLRIGDAAAAYTKVASGIAAGEMVNVKLTVAIGEAGFTTDMTVTDKSGAVLGEAKNIDMLGYSANGIEKLLMGYADSMLIDNVKVYDYGYSDAPVVPDEPEEDELTSLEVERKDQENTAKDGDIELCKPADIYVNEDFSGDKLPTGDTASGLATWKFNANSSIDDNGSLYLPTSTAEAKTLAQATLKTPVTGEGNKFVLDYDFCYKSPITADGVATFFFISGNKNALWVDTEPDGTYRLRAGGPNSSNTTFIGGNKPQDVLNIRMEITIQEAELKGDITVTNTTTGVVGSLKDFSLHGYDATANGITNFYWGYQGFDMTIDNVKFYKYCTAPEPKNIVEAEIPGVPAADKYIVNESFDELSTIANRYKDASGNTWTCPGGTSIPLVNMTSGRKVMKLADNVSWMSIVPSSIITYNPEEGANNTYVLKFGVKNLAVKGENSVYNDFIRWVADNNGTDNRVVDGLINFNGNQIRTTNNLIVNGEYQWYTIAVVFELGAEKSYATTYVLDGNKTLKGATVEAATNNIKYFRIAASALNAAYVDNLQLYAAGSEVAVGEVPELSVSNVKLTTEEGDVVLTNVPANTEVTLSAEVSFANEKPVAYIPQGIVAAYKKLSDGSLQLAGADFMDLVYSTYSAPLFTSDSEGGEYIVKLYSWKDMNNMVASGTAVELGK